MNYFLVVIQRCWMWAWWINSVAQELLRWLRLVGLVGVFHMKITFMRVTSSVESKYENNHVLYLSHPKVNRGNRRIGENLIYLDLFFQILTAFRFK